MDERDLRHVLQEHFADVRATMNETLGTMARVLDGHMAKTEAAIDLALRQDAAEHQAQLADLASRIERIEERLGLSG